ncbi:N-acetyltransferase [uncultured Sulfitobacter sp.]|uniref:GNAT family N-acetyltransferase n=1 Tax=uncultured Sulfitobacter sp. TaxID=191468 RepID=UPI0026076ABC|nr:N-acetyltransferase [uncultured Sulfitobacter sp.]
MYDLAAETASDRWEVEALYDTCFAPGRTALSSYRLREGVPPVAGLSLVARDDLGILAGAIRFWPVNVGGHEALLLGPVAVHPTRQGEGLGALLIETSLALATPEGGEVHQSAQLARADQKTWERVMLVGDAPYYGRYGFAPLQGVIMPPPTNPERVLGRALRVGAWDGVTGDVTRAG